MGKSGTARRISLGLGLAMALGAPQGCTNFQRQGCTSPPSYVFTYLKNRLKDALECADIGVTVTGKPGYGLYAAFMSAAPLGYGQADGYHIGIGGGDIGLMRINYDHIGLLAWGRERVGWGDGFLFHHDGLDVDKPETMNCQGVGPLGFLLPPYDRRPAAAPT